MGPLVSVIMPCYNAGRMLEPALWSVFSQTYPNLELIFVDNNSTDGSAERARTIAADHGRPFHFIQCEAQGANHAREAGYRLARGDYIQWMDADDALGLQKIALQVAALEQDRNAAIAYCDWMSSRHTPDGRRTDKVNALRQEDDQIRRNLSGIWYPPHSYLIRRDAADRLREEQAWWPDTKIGTDVEYATIAALLGMRFVHVPGAKVQYNSWSTTQTSSSGTRYSDRIASLATIWQRLRGLAERPDVAPRVTDAHRILLDQDWHAWTMPIGSVEISTLTPERHALRHVATDHAIQVDAREATVATAMLALGNIEATAHHALKIAASVPALGFDHVFIVATLDRFRREGLLTRIEPEALDATRTAAMAVPTAGVTPAMRPSAAPGTREVVAEAWNDVMRGRGLAENQRFDAAGGDSLRLLSLTLSFEERLGVPVSLDDLSLRMRPSDFTRVLDGILARRETKAPAASTERPTLFLIGPRHHIDPSEAVMRRTCGTLAEVISLRLPEWRALARPGFTISALVDQIVAEINRRSGPGAIMLSGMCLGGMLAHAVAQRLAAAGRTIGYVGILDGDVKWAKEGANPFPLRALRAMRLVMRENKLFAGPVPMISRFLASRPRLLRWLGHGTRTGRLPKQFAARLDWYLNTDVPGRFDGGGLARLWEGTPPLDAPVYLFRALEQAPDAPADLNWRDLCASLTVVPVLGGHMTMFEPENLPVLSRAVSRSLLRRLTPEDDAAATPTFEYAD
jgi:thioesterase domain-containing protein/GT2 family glycosyltransferase